MVLSYCGSVCGRTQKRLVFALLSGRKLSFSTCLDARHFGSSPYATSALQGAALVLELKGNESG